MLCAVHVFSLKAQSDEESQQDPILTIQQNIQASSKKKKKKPHKNGMN